MANDNDSPTARGRRHLPAGPSLPPGLSSLQSSLASGRAVSVDGTNVVRVPFGVRRPRRSRPARPERWATVILPFQGGGLSPTPPPAAA